MKLKLLLTALVGITLVACQEDDFVVNKTPEGKSPITFTVHKNGEATRADLTEKYKLTFEAGDLISLYHGMNDAAVESELLSPGYTFYSNYGNAIYEGVGGGDDAFKLSTKSIVLEGGAVMVYPADTTMNWYSTAGQEKATVSIAADQKNFIRNGKEYQYRNFLPQISDYMVIGAYQDDQLPGEPGYNGPNNTAGYGRNYDVVLKPFGTIYALTLNATGLEAFDDLEAAGIDAIAFDRVKISNGTELFNTKVTISPNGASTLSTAPYTHFKYQTEIDFTNGVLEQSTFLATNDIENGVAYFVLLPNTNTATPEDAVQIEVETTYGTITLVNDGAKKPITRTDGTPNSESTIKEALSSLLGNTWYAQTGLFNGAKGGVAMERTLTFDLKDINMNNTRVKSSEHLVNILKVYNALGKDDDLTLILDPKDDNDKPSNWFVLLEDALNMSLDMGNKLTLDVSTVGKPIALDYCDSEILDKLTDLQFNDDINLKLKIVAELDQADEFTNIATVTNHGSLLVTNKNGKPKAEPFNALTVAAGGTLIIDGTVYMDKLITEAASDPFPAAKIEIPAGSVLYACGSGTELRGITENKGQLTSYNSTSGAIRNLGTIENYGEITAVNGNNFYNGGIIENKEAGCVVYITKQKLSTPSCTGRIILKERNDDVSISNGDGYVVWNKDVDAAGFAVTEEDGDKFNYLVLNVKADKAPINITAMSEKVKTLRVDGEQGNFTYAKKDVDGNPVEFELTDLIANKMYYPTTNGILKATSIYSKTRILHGGGIEGTQGTSYSPGYFGGGSESFNGVIETIK